MFSNSSRLPQAEIFNTNDFVINNNQFTVQTDFNESQFLRNSGGIVTGDIILTGTSKLIFENGSTQRFAFDEDNLNAINTSNDKVQAINFVDGTTIINSDLTVNGNITIPDNSLTTSKISGLSSDISALQSGQTGLIASVEINTEDINDIKNYNTQNTIDINNITNDISEINTEVDNIKIVNDTQNITIGENSSHIEDIQASLITINDSILSHSNSLTTHTNEINIVESSFTNLSNIVSGIQTDLTTAESNIATLQEDFIALNNSVPTNENFGHLNNSVDVIENNIIDINTHLGVLDTTTDNINNSINTINTDLTNKQTSINTINTEITNINNEIETMSDNISNASSALITQGNQINALISQDTNLLNQINTKQNIINEFNFLDISFIGSGTITNEQLETLAGIDTTETIQYQIDSIKTNVSNLTSLQNVDIPNINALQTDNTSNKNRLTSLEGINITQNTINNNIAAQIATQGTTITNVSNNLNAYQTSNNATIATMQTDLTNNTTSINQVSANLASFQTSHNLAISSLTSSIDATNANVNANTDLINDVNANLVAFQQSNPGSFSTLQTNIDNVADNLASYETSNDLAINQLQTNIDSVADNLASYETSNDLVITQLQNNLNTLNTDIASNTLDIQANETAISQLSSSLATTNANNTTLQTNINNVANDLASYETSNDLALTQLQNNLNTIATDIQTNILDMQTNETAISQLQAQDTVHTGLIATNTTNIAQNTSDILLKEDIINASHRIESEFINTYETETLDITILRIDTTLNNLNTSKQNVINSSNKLNSSLLQRDDNLQYIDISSSLQNQLNSLSGSISTLTSLQNGDVASFQAIDDNFDTIGATLLTKQNTINTDNKLNADYVDVSGTILSEVISGINSSVATLTGLQAGDVSSFNNVNTSIATLNTFKDNQLTLNDTIDSFITSHGNEIASLQTSLNDLDNAKQDIISADNKLNSSLLNRNDNLQYMDINTSLSTQLANINNSLTTLTNYDSAQSTLNSSFTDSINANASAITNLGNTKQNVITGASRLDTLLISHDGSSMNTIIDNLINADTGFTSSITNLNNSLTTKQNIINGSNKLPIANVDITGSALAHVNINSDLQESLNTINNNISTLQTAHDTNATNIVTLQNADIQHDNLISQLNSDVLENQTLANSKVSISDYNLKMTELDAKDLLHDTTFDDVYTQISTKQNIINAENKISISNIDLSGSNLTHIDITSPLQAQLTTITNNISTLNSLQAGDITSFQDINTSIADLNSNLLLKEDSIGPVRNKLVFLDNVTSDIQSQLNNLSGSGVQSISYDAPSLTTTITDKTALTTLEFGDMTQQTTAFTSALSSKITTNETNINTLNTTVATHDTSIDDLQSAIITKQDIIDGQNKLSISNVDLSGSSLEFIDINTGLASTLTGINTAINGLQNYDIAQTALNTTFTTDIGSLNSGKQDTLSTNNKLSSDFVSYNGDTVTNKFISLDNTISGLSSGGTNYDTAINNINTELSFKMDFRNNITLSNQLQVSNLKRLVIDAGSTIRYIDAIGGPVGMILRSDNTQGIFTAQVNPNDALIATNTTNIANLTTNVNNNTSAISTLNTSVNNINNTMIQPNTVLPLTGGIMSGIVYNHSVAEKTVLQNPSANVFTLDIRLGNMFYCTTQPTSNFTINVIGLSDVAGDTSNAITTFSLIHSANFFCNSISVADSNSVLIMNAQMPKYPDGNTPLMSGTKTYVQTFSFLRCLATKIVVSNVTAFA